MPSLAAVIHEIINDPNFGSNNEVYLVELYNRINALNYAQLQGMHTHLLRSSETADSKIWRVANNELLSHVSKVLKSRNEEIAEEKRLEEEVNAIRRKKREARRGKKEERARVLKHYRVKAREEAEKEIYENERRREAAEKVEIHEKEPHASRQRLKYVVVAVLVLLIGCTIVGVAVPKDPILIGILISLVIVISAFILWRAYIVGRLVPIVVTKTDIEKAIEIREEELLQMSMAAVAENERLFKLKEEHEREERGRLRAKRKRENIVRRSTIFGSDPAEFSDDSDSQAEDDSSSEYEDEEGKAPQPAEDMIRIGNHSPFAGGNREILPMSTEFGSVDKLEDPALAASGRRRSSQLRQKPSTNPEKDAQLCSEALDSMVVENIESVPPSPRPTGRRRSSMKAKSPFARRRSSAMRETPAFSSLHIAVTCVACEGLKSPKAVPEGLSTLNLYLIIEVSSHPQRTRTGNDDRFREVPSPRVQQNTTNRVLAMSFRSSTQWGMQEENDVSWRFGGGGNRRTSGKFHTPLDIETGLTEDDGMRDSSLSPPRAQDLRKNSTTQQIRKGIEADLITDETVVLKLFTTDGSHLESKENVPATRRRSSINSAPVDTLLGILEVSAAELARERFLSPGDAVTLHKNFLRNNIITPIVVEIIVNVTVENSSSLFEKT